MESRAEKLSRVRRLNAELGIWAGYDLVDILVEFPPEDLNRLTAEATGTVLAACYAARRRKENRQEKARRVEVTPGGLGLTERMAAEPHLHLLRYVCGVGPRFTASPL